MTTIALTNKYELKQTECQRPKWNQVEQTAALVEAELAATLVLEWR